MYTEEEAKTKWCPQVRAASGSADENSSNCGIYDFDRVPTYSRCIASGCMAWRWGKIVNPSLVKGYCGLAGAP